MNRLVIVSNRVGDVHNPTQTGGLAVAIADALRRRGGVWFGCTGEGDTDGTRTTEDGNVKTITASLSENEYQDYYIGYSNSVLWPLFHYRADLIDYQESFFRGYARVNRRLARQLLPQLYPDDIVWVHDYHLLPFARCLRRAGAKHRIGFFLHIPFPPPELLTASPNHAALIEAMLDYDLIGFQTSTDLMNFHRYIEEHALGMITIDNAVCTRTGTTRCGRFPISIDVEDFRRMAESADDDFRIDEVRRNILKQKQIVGIDRLDYSKGIPARFEAFERLLATHPEMERTVSLLQISPPTREGIKAYEEIRSVTEELSGAINGRFADLNWTPIRYIHRSIPRDRLAKILRSSEVGLVTPLRDGMNLVAKEYVAAQDPDDPGVLVLSQFAGASEDLVEALIVNPYDMDEMARRLFQALTMPLKERKKRHRALYNRLVAADVDMWADSFLQVLEQCRTDAEKPRGPQTGPPVSNRPLGANPEQNGLQQVLGF
ncbi:trehalose-6-phosphate synthase [Nitratireductor sp. ZSWI3]|uniref:alpha,alpha-trehalose-phosphate synthase (UDP-forming) n=1 Tax=Nitratireductor sp. ZSWI3 TaxID=2966359 RepID=UPI00215059DC|nr:trehalose-6-phosphate synthase [Nitratireductor sp. ZSWI3]MCR4264692.1 trehalose-6-phosphate synthase [Nitratireductor sp. ZSWI3]